MSRAKRTMESTLTPCATCSNPTELEHRCQQCRDIGGGFVLDPPEDCVFVSLSPVGNHRNTSITDCAYKCGRADCYYGKRYNRVDGPKVTQKRVVFRAKAKGRAR